MGKIREYELVVELAGDETFIVETDDGTKSLSYAQLEYWVRSRYDEYTGDNIKDVIRDMIDSGEISFDGGSIPGVGTDGKSAYELAVENGFSGTVQQWLESLHGADGGKGDTGEQGPVGATGAPGADGYTPVKGKDYFTDADIQSVINRIPSGGTGASIIVDSELSHTSVNPLQNRAIYDAIKSATGEITNSVVIDQNSLKTGYISWEYGSLYVSDTWKASDYIDCAGVDGITAIWDCNVYSECYHNAFYDSDKNFIKFAELLNGIEITVPSNAEYIRISNKEEVMKNVCLVTRNGESRFELKNGTSIFDHNSESEITNIFNQIVKPAASWQNTSPNLKPLVLAHFSDVHNSGMSTKRVVDFSKKYANYIDDVICTGDFINESTDSFSYWEETGAEKVLLSIGNHDVGVLGSNRTPISSVNTYNKYIKPFINNWGVVQPQNAEKNGYSYYYKDYAESGYRLVVIDALHWDSTQLSWFQNALNSAKNSGLHVVAAQHFPPFEWVKITGTTFMDVDSPTTETAYVEQSSVLNAVDNFINAGGKFACWLGGHMHIDMVTHPVGHPKQLFINIDATLLGDTYSASNIIVGTKSQDCVNVVGFEKSKSIIKVYRVGRNTDHYLRKKESFAWDYANQKLLHINGEIISEGEGYSKSEIDNALGSYISDVAKLVGGNA